MPESNDKIQAWVTKIQNQDRMTRQRALKELLEYCEDEKNLTPENCTEMFDTFYLYLIKCYGDRFEMCRSLAGLIVTELLKRLEQNDYYLNYIVPVIARRIGQVEMVEESEEMRLQLLEQLNFIVSKYKDLIDHGSVRIGDGKDVLLKPYNDIIDILKVCLLDTYPAILRECCSIIKTTSEASTSFHYRAESLVDPLVYLLKHRQSPVRIAAIEALTIVCLNIHTNGEAVKKIICDLSPLVMDPVPYVRRECGRAGCTWLTKLRDRYSFFERILPLVLCCLADETQEVRQEITEKWKEAGQLYYQENEAELQGQLLLEKPGDGRPTIGCRALVKRSLKVLDVVLREMEDWKEEVRLHSTKLLKQIVIHSEDYLATKYWDINAVLCKTCMDSEPTVASEALEVARLVGIFVDCKTWSKYIYEEIKVRQNKLGIVKCLRRLFASSEDPGKWEELGNLIECFLDTSICHCDLEVQQIELFGLIETILDGWESHVQKSEGFEVIERNLYIVLLKSTAVNYDNENLRDFGLKLLGKMASGNPELLELPKLHSQYLKEALDSLDALDRANDGEFEQVRILHGIICLCGFQVSDPFQTLENFLFKEYEKKTGWCVHESDKKH
jgi:dynein assembly factor 5